MQPCSRIYYSIVSQPKTYVKPEDVIKVVELLMMGGVSPEICWAIKKHRNNKFYYTVASFWFFLWDLKPNEDDRFHDLLLRFFFFFKKSCSFNVSEFRAKFCQTKASPLLTASRDKLSTPIILSVTCFCMTQFHWCPHEFDRIAMAMGDKHINVTVPVCHPIQFTLLYQVLCNLYYNQMQQYNNILVNNRTFIGNNIKNSATCFGSIEPSSYKIQYWYIQRVLTLRDHILFTNCIDIIHHHSNKTPN